MISCPDDLQIQISNNTYPVPNLKNSLFIKRKSAFCWNHGSLHDPGWGSGLNVETAMNSRILLLILSTFDEPLEIKGLHIQLMQVRFLVSILIIRASVTHLYY
jgi:hypothetical protein